MLSLSGLYRYPLKSGRGEALQRSAVDGLGLHGDRRWMLVDADNGRFITQRLLPQMSQLSALYDARGGLTLSAPGREDLSVALPDPEQDLRGVVVWRDSLRVPDAGDAAAAWLSDLLGKTCRLVQVPEGRTRQVDTAYAQPGIAWPSPMAFHCCLLARHRWTIFRNVSGSRCPCCASAPIWSLPAVRHMPRMAGNASASVKWSSR